MTATNVSYQDVAQFMEGAVLEIAQKLLIPNNTVTTLEIKTALIAAYPNIAWNQKYVSDTMMKIANSSEFTYVDNGTYRIYSKIVVKTVPSAKATPTTKVKTAPTSGGTISRTKALEMMKGNKGHFFTATFQKKAAKGKTVGEMRTINCQYMTQQKDTPLGYIKVKEGKLLKQVKNSNGNENDAIRSINLQTLVALKIANKIYKVK